MSYYDKHDNLVFWQNKKNPKEKKIAKITVNTKSSDRDGIFRKKMSYIIFYAKFINT